MSQMQQHVGGLGFIQSFAVVTSGGRNTVETLITSLKVMTSVLAWPTPSARGKGASLGPPAPSHQTEQTPGLPPAANLPRCRVGRSLRPANCLAKRRHIWETAPAPAGKAAPAACTVEDRVTPLQRDAFLGSLVLRPNPPGADHCA